jgi:hypothetical protein
MRDNRRGEMRCERIELRSEKFFTAVAPLKERNNRYKK